MVQVHGFDPHHVTTGHHQRGIQVPGVTGRDGSINQPGGWVRHTHGCGVHTRVGSQVVVAQVGVAGDEVPFEQGSNGELAAVACARGDLDGGFRPGVIELDQVGITANRVAGAIVDGELHPPQGITRRVPLGKHAVDVLGEIDVVEAQRDRIGFMHPGGAILAGEGQIGHHSGGSAATVGGNLHFIAVQRAPGLPGR